MAKEGKYASPDRNKHNEKYKRISHKVVEATNHNTDENNSKKGTHDQTNANVWHKCLLSVPKAATLRLTA
jgi:hypothetical protein